MLIKPNLRWSALEHLEDMPGSYLLQLTSASFQPGPMPMYHPLGYAVLSNRCRGYAVGGFPCHRWRTSHARRAKWEIAGLRIPNTFVLVPLVRPDSSPSIFVWPPLARLNSSQNSSRVEVKFYHQNLFVDWKAIPVTRNWSSS